MSYNQQLNDLKYTGATLDAGTGQQVRKKEPHSKHRHSSTTTSDAPDERMLLYWPVLFSSFVVLTHTLLY